MRTHQLLQVYWLIELLSGVSVLQAKVVRHNAYCEMGPCYSVNLPCDNKGKIKRCHVNAKLLREGDYRYTLQDTFNKLRNNVAGGKMYRNLPAAASMGRMIWNTELAYFAKLDVSRCEVNPRPCMSSSKFDLMGNLAGMDRYMSDNSSLTLRETIQHIAQSWFNDIRSITRLDTLNLAVTAKESGILSTTLLLIEYNTNFGCAALRYLNNVYYYVILSCVFGTDNQDGQKLYKWGVSPGVKCRRRDRKYINLCAKGQTYETKKPKTHFIQMSKDWY